MHAAKAQQVSDVFTHANKILAGILAISDDAIISLDHTQRIVVFNEGAEKVFGYSADEALGQPLELLLPESIRRAHQALVKGFGSDKVASKKASSRQPIEGRRKDGSEFPAEASISKIDTEDGPLFTVILRDITERLEVERRLSEMAQHDALTGLANRAMFTELLNRAISRAKRSGSAVIVMFIDLDRFKKINDSLGHDVGDLLLKEISRRFSGSLRESDVIARMGGDEFTVVLERPAESSEEQVSAQRSAAIVAEKLLEVARRPVRLDGQEVFVAASIGVAFAAGLEADADTLIKNADMAMYRAKQDGGDNFHFHSEEMSAEALGRLAMEGELHHALDRGEFVLHYQPIMRIPDGGLLGVEAFLRWQHPRGRLMTPEGFMPVAEETGLIVRIGDWVLTTACRQMCDWIDQGRAMSRLAVNLSARQFRDKGLPALICRVLADTGLPPDVLELEVTEGLLTGSPDAAFERLQELKTFGVRLSIDDFGMGVSSLNYLKGCPIDVLKIDGNFVRKLGRSSKDAAIAASVIELAHNLQMEVVAEGVETDAQLAWLAAQGCDAAQGYYFCHPMPAEDLGEPLRMDLLDAPPAQSSPAAGV
ncbi:MAG: EAL domain-containing protein [Alphaproteobacteria bacterium]|nr:EAL domain-containing protein [Alphaproteobacteria bacterium]